MATRQLFADSAHALVDQGVQRKSFKHPAPRVVAVAFIASAEAVLADCARTGSSEYEATLSHLPSLFITALTA